MSRRVATITLNPAYDLVGFCPEIERGEVNLVRTAGLHAAGKGINVAKVLKDLGIDVTVGGFLGKDNQDGFQLLFSDLGIANRFQVVPGRTRINVKLTEKDGEVTDFNFSGFEVTPQDWERFVVDSLSWLGQFDMVAVSGSLPAGVAPEAFTEWMTRLRAQCEYLQKYNMIGCDITDAHGSVRLYGLEIYGYEECVERVGELLDSCQEAVSGMCGK